MATVRLNALVGGFSGKLGDLLVFRTMRGKTFVSTPARKPDKKKESAAQRDTRNKFKEASDWASFIILDAKQKAYYQQRARKLKLPNAYTAALTDYMRSPKLTTFNELNKSTNYKIGKKDFAVKQIEIVLNDNNGNAKEMRTIQPTHNHYTFTLTERDLLLGGRISVTDASDRIKSWLLSDEPT